MVIRWVHRLNFLHFKTLWVSVHFNSFKWIGYMNCYSQQRKTRLFCKARSVFGLSFVTSATFATSQLSLIRYPAKLVPNCASQLNSPLKCSCSSVTSEKKQTPDKSCSDIAVLIFASIQALLEPAGANGFILHCHNKNKRPMKDPPPPRLGVD